LLRALQEKQIDPVGGRHSIPVDARIIATTNQDLAMLVTQGQFREDLYYRLRVIPLVVPPLRSRKEDIQILIEHFVDKFKPDNENSKPCFAQEALEKMKAWHWPGNVRELENTVERALLISTSNEIESHALLLDCGLQGNSLNEAAALVGLTVKELEHKLIKQTLSHVNQNRTAAAEMLGISIRTLRNKLREYRTSEQHDAT
jgi:DNA-binding NtrC family response regulator